MLKLQWGQCYSFNSSAFRVITEQRQRALNVAALTDGVFFAVGSVRVVHDVGATQFFGRECNHGDGHASATNAGFSRKPNGGGFCKSCVCVTVT